MKTATEQDYRMRILRVLIYIQQHLDDAVSLDELAGIASFSPFHFHRVFRGMIGESVMEHIRRLRLERAAADLKFGSKSITAIAFDAGYETLDAFTRAFKSLFDATPTAWRSENRVQFPAAPVSGIHYNPRQILRDFEPITTGAPTMDVEVKTLPKFKVAFVRCTGPYSKSAAESWAKLCSWAGPKGLLGPQTKYIGVSYDDPDITPPEKIRYDACITLSRDIQPEGDIGVQELGGGEFAVTVHQGPYENLSNTYSRLCGEWIPKHGYRFGAQPSLEIYLNDPDRTPSEQWLTEIYLAVEKE